MNRWRDLYCGEVSPKRVGETLSVSGWVARRRDHGGLIFIDLRDHTGIVQLVINPERAPEAAKVAHDIRSEFVVHARGEVVRRAPEAVNPNVPTGEVEIQVDDLEIVARSEPLPFQLDDEGVEEPVRLRYRYLDLRRDRMQRNLRLSATVITAIRRSMEEQGFIDIWTPSMTLGTPEGARDFLVPVRLQPGKFFALAQSPQLFKQTFMIGGLDRYYQIATAWRDEDLRADRQFEFRQLDLELAFPTREDVLEVLERVVVASFEALGRTPPSRPFPRMAYSDAMLRYGSDKPDVRFGLEIQDATDVTRGSEFGVFAARKPSATSSRRKRSRVASCRSSRSSQRSGARRVLRISSSTTRVRCGRRSPNSSPSRRSKRSALHPDRRSSLPPTARRWWSVSSAPFGSSSAINSSFSTRRATRSSGFSTSRCS